MNKTELIITTTITPTQKEWKETLERLKAHIELVKVTKEITKNRRCFN